MVDIDNGKWNNYKVYAKLGRIQQLATVAKYNADEVYLTWTTNGENSCSKCMDLDGETRLVEEWDVQPPLHPNCDCTLELADNTTHDAEDSDEQVWEDATGMTLHPDYSHYKGIECDYDNLECRGLVEDESTGLSVVEYFQHPKAARRAWVLKKFGDETEGSLLHNFGAILYIANEFTPERPEESITLGGGVRRQGGKQAQKLLHYITRHMDMPTPRPKGMQSHHGVMSKWMETHFSEYSENKSPAILILNHQKTFSVFNKWRAKMKIKMGGTFDWKRVTEKEIRDLSERMFDAVDVPQVVRDQYWVEYKKMTRMLNK